MLNKSESIKNLATALTKVQAQLKPAEETAYNPFFKSRYADLESIVTAARILLADNGLSVSQFPGKTDGGKVELTTILMHESGEWLENTAVLPLAKSDPQGYGSAITYARRYAFAAAVGVIAGEDDDGNTASQPHPNQPPAKAKPAKNSSKPPAQDDKPEPVKAQSSAKLMSAGDFLNYVVKNVARYDNTHAVVNAAKLLGFSQVPSVAESRKRYFQAVKDYALYRDSGLNQEHAIAATHDTIAKEQG